jgi:O-methyltransferase
MIKLLKKVVKKTVESMGYEIRELEYPCEEARPEATGIPEAIRGHADASFYDPLFSPWKGYGEFAEYLQLTQEYTLVSADRCYLLFSIAKQAIHLGGEFWECGVYKGGTAKLLAALLEKKSATHAVLPLKLFDTFEGMPETDPDKDWHRLGDFSDTSLEAVRERIGTEKMHVSYYKGFIPETFAGNENSQIGFAHIDVDIYRSIIDCCEFIYPRMLLGGFMVFDDYGFPTCPGARQAVDEFFAGKKEEPLVLPTGQAIVTVIH